MKALSPVPAETPPSARVAAGFGEGSALVVAVAALAFALAVLGTRQIPLIDRDEGRYAEAAREMLVSGDWLVPRIFGVPYLEKPPLFYWLTTASYAVVGVNELGARLVPALSAALGVLVTGLFARRAFGASAGVLGAAVLATSGLHLLLARVAITDMLFSMLLSSALFTFYVAETEQRTFVPFWLLAAAATLTKGPVAPVLCGLVGCAHLALADRWSTLATRRFWGGFPLFLAVVLPWFALVEARYPAFLPYYVYKEHLLRVAGDEHREGFWWYLPWIVAGFLPWTVVAAGALPAIRGRLRELSAEGAAARFLVAWAVIVVGFFSVPRGKLVPYILPAFPPLAALVGDALDRWSRGVLASRALPRAFWTIGAVFLLAPLLLPLVVRLSPVPIPPSFVALAAATAIAAGAFTIALAHRGDWKPIGAVMASVVAIEAVAVVVASPIVAYLTTLPVIERIREKLGPDDEVVLYGGYFPNVPFYLGRIPHYVFGNRELEFGQSLEGPGPWIVHDLAALEDRVGSRRLLIVLKTRDRDFRDLAKMSGETEILYRGRSSSLIEHRP